LKDKRDRVISGIKLRRRWILIYISPSRQRHVKMKQDDKTGPIKRFAIFIQHHLIRHVFVKVLYTIVQL